MEHEQYSTCNFIFVEHEQYNTCRVSVHFFQAAVLLVSRRHSDICLGGGVISLIASLWFARVRRITDWFRNYVFGQFVRRGFSEGKVRVARPFHLRERQREMGKKSCRLPSILGVPRYNCTNKWDFGTFTCIFLNFWWYHRIPWWKLINYREENKEVWIWLIILILLTIEFLA